MERVPSHQMLNLPKTGRSWGFAGCYDFPCSALALHIGFPKWVMHSNAPKCRTDSIVFFVVLLSFLGVLHVLHALLSKSF